MEGLRRLKSEIPGSSFWEKVSYRMGKVFPFWFFKVSFISLENRRFVFYNCRCSTVVSILTVLAVPNMGSRSHMGVHFRYIIPDILIVISVSVYSI